MSDTPANGPSLAESPPAPPPAASLAQDTDAIPQTRWSVGAWALEGLRAGVFLRPNAMGRSVESPGPWQVLALFVLSDALQLGAERFTVPGAAQFQLVPWLAPWWVSLASLWMAWWAMRGVPPADRAGVSVGGRLAAWFALTSWVSMPAVLLSIGLQAWMARQPELAHVWQLPLWWAQWALTIWAVAAYLWMSARFFASRWRTAVFSLVTVVLVGVGMWSYPGPAWTQDPTANAVPEPEPLHLSQDVFEAQQALWQRQVQALAAQRDGVVDVYGLVFAPYASENVFRRESTLVREVLEQRFGARGRVIQLLNHAQTATTHVWATPQNLQRAVAALGARMDREHDVLVVYLTSHGGQDHQLAAMHWPLEVPSISPEVLRQALDDAGIRHRVIAVSACFSGGWIEPLATDSTLVMTAADATHTSYGCGHRSELTFFGRAMFDEQLRSTRSFTQAFANAVPLIRQREIDAGKDDGFSNPQISVGREIAPVLDALAARLDSEPSD